MEHRGALRKTNAIDLGLDGRSRSRSAYDEFQCFVQQSHGRSAIEFTESRQARNELRRHPKPNSCDAEISIPVPSTGNPGWRQKQRSVTHDAVTDDSTVNNHWNDAAAEIEVIDSRASDRSRVQDVSRHGQRRPSMRESRSLSANARAGQTHDSHEHLKAENAARKHLTVPGQEETCTMRRSNFQTARSAEQLNPTSRDSRAGRGETLVRNFATSAKGVINIGDSYRSADSSPVWIASPTISRRSSGAYNHHSTPQLSADARRGKVSCRTQQSSDSAGSSTKSSNVYTVYVLGAQGVGKSSLRRQLATSEFLGSDPDLLDEDDFSNNSNDVAVQLDDHLANVQFIEIPPDNRVSAMDSEDVDAYLIVYAIDEISSFRFAEQTLTIMLPKTSRRAPAFLVGNKSDLKRTQLVSTDEGKSLARHTQSIFVETSATLSHGLDQMLVQIVQEANNRFQPTSKSRDHTGKVTKWLGKLSGKISPKPKAWHSSTKRSFEAYPDD